MRILFFLLSGLFCTSQRLCADKSKRPKKVHSSNGHLYLGVKIRDNLTLSAKKGSNYEAYEGAVAFLSEGIRVQGGFIYHFMKYFYHGLMLGLTFSKELANSQPKDLGFISNSLDHLSLMMPFGVRKIYRQFEFFTEGNILLGLRPAQKMEPNLLFGVRFMVLKGREVRK